MLTGMGVKEPKVAFVGSVSQPGLVGGETIKPLTTIKERSDSRLFPLGQARNYFFDGSRVTHPYSNRARTTKRRGAEPIYSNGKQVMSVTHGLWVRSTAPANPARSPARLHLIDKTSRRGPHANHVSAIDSAERAKEGIAMA